MSNSLGVAVYCLGKRRKGGIAMRKVGRDDDGSRDRATRQGAWIFIGGVALVTVGAIAGTTVVGAGAAPFLLGAGAVLVVVGGHFIWEAPVASWKARWFPRSNRPGADRAHPSGGSSPLPRSQGAEARLWQSGEDVQVRKDPGPRTKCA